MRNISPKDLLLDGLQVFNRCYQTWWNLKRKLQEFLDQPTCTLKEKHRGLLLWSQILQASKDHTKTSKIKRLASLVVRSQLRTEHRIRESIVEDEQVNSGRTVMISKCCWASAPSPYTLIGKQNIGSLHDQNHHSKKPSLFRWPLKLYTIYLNYIISQVFLQSGIIHPKTFRLKSRESKSGGMSRVS